MLSCRLGCKKKVLSESLASRYLVRGASEAKEKLGLTCVNRASFKNSIKFAKFHFSQIISFLLLFRCRWQHVRHQTSNKKPFCGPQVADNILDFFHFILQ